MASPTSNHYLETQLWLANALEQTAAWRDDKKADYPDDPRNGRSAMALRLAAHYIRGASDNPSLRRFAELVNDSLASGVDLLETPDFLGPESDRIAGRYGFDKFGDVQTAADHEVLIDDLYEAILRDLRGHNITPGSPLARRLNPPPEAVRVSPAGLGRIDRLSRLGDLLLGLADRAEEEGFDDTKGQRRLPGPPQPTRMPRLRRRISIELRALHALGAAVLEETTRLVEQPPEFVSPTVSGVIGALEEVARALDAEAAAVEV